MLRIDVQNLPRNSKIKKIVYYFGELYAFCAFKEYFGQAYYDVQDDANINNLFDEMLQYQLSHKVGAKVRDCLQQDYLSDIGPGGMCPCAYSLKGSTNVFLSSHKEFILKHVCNENCDVGKQTNFFKMFDMVHNPKSPNYYMDESICYLIRAARIIKRYEPSTSLNMNWNKANQLYKNMKDYKKKIQAQKQKRHAKEEKQIKQEMADQRKIAKQEAIKVRESNELVKTKTETKNKQEQHKLKEQLQNKPLWYKTSVLITNKVKNFM